MSVICGIGEFAPGGREQGSGNALDNWDDLRFCLALERFGTMTAAAKALGTNTATVSRRIERLSEEMGVPLFIKDGTGWVVTPTGKTLVDIASLTENSLQETSLPSHAGGSQTLRINCDLTVIQTHLIFSINAFLRDHPETDIRLSMFPASLAYGETDILISRIEPISGRLIRKRLRTGQCRPYVSACFASAVTGWISIASDVYTCNAELALQNILDMGPRITLNGLNIARHLMKQAPLACVMPDDYAGHFDDLVPMAGASASTYDVWLAYHQSRRNDRLIEDAVDWIDRTMSRQAVSRQSA